MNLLVVLLIVILLCGGLGGGYYGGSGYAYGGSLGFILIVLAVLWFSGVLGPRPGP
jgi:hypothetical protein